MVGLHSRKDLGMVSEGRLMGLGSLDFLTTVRFLVSWGEGVELGGFLREYVWFFTVDAWVFGGLTFARSWA